MTQQFLIIGFDPESPATTAFINELRSAWPDPEDQDWAVAAIPHHRLAITDPRLSECSVALLRAEGEDLPEGFFPLLESLSDNGVPVIVLASDYLEVRERLYEDDLIVCPAEESASGIALRLHALASRQRTVSNLRRELATARRYQGGLQGEITRIEEELQLAARIQREFLPRSLPKIGDVRFGVFFRPAGYVSGDIYNIARLDEDHIAFFLADAVGHGVPAALMTMVIAHSLRMKDIDENGYRIIPPAEVLSRLNESILHHHAENGRFATGVYGVVNTSNHTVRVSTAGHPPPLRINGRGEFEHLELEGGLLGVFPGERYEEKSFSLEPGDRFFVYSDGFEMAFPDQAEARKIREGKRRMPTLRYIDEIREACKPGHDVSETIDSLAHAVDSQPGSLHQIDDLTGICLSRLPEAASSSFDDDTARRNKADFIPEKRARPPAAA